ncbi:MAG: pyruvate carboxylase subunit B [Desulfobacula sp.]|jgi:oxaloacetate decarboxylase alpha subunit/pyruvate carboxylase subunit B|uniref:pyruvate carboxylase subunit B n=2 Tax=Desulfobacula sp. TaxID=2593537 RepID=UPI001D97F990|nr:pyruvate carboxylase subunit B [Desulfobacula sp.]MBT3487033.1 pyruvate carboxylase subunit B [Desulfobacula sp.]MBT3806133.1 pyruvate carboxylase subunit B [Desulfobacula sp.]MBT4026827.1 pyruvate carboxylase subunit B [Desulfobacula sp.]MBT4199565.1 pyruvate carboxylase subunit B [Desulfobacula sp.]
MTEHTQVKMAEMKYDKDRPKAKHELKVEDISLRDGHQSLFATRGRTEDMIPVAERMDEIGFWAVEVWGGATFDAMHRFLGEDPWERLRTLKRYFKKTPFSMLLRGQNLVGYRNYADDVAKLFVKKTVDNGMEVFRTFDALNDYRNFETVVPVIKECGAHFQGCICYTLTEPRIGGDVYTLEYYIQKAKDLEAMGADSICVKDMAGLLAPYDAYKLIKALKDNVKPLIHLHSHFTSGMSPMSHFKAIEAGVDIIDTCLTPYAYRTSHAALEPFVMSLLGTNRDTGFDINALADINEILEKQIMPKYKHLLDNTKVSGIDINVLLHQTPGGMLSNLVNQLRDMDALDKMDDVLKELPRVRKELGQIPLVTPTSQIVGIQTVNNVLFDTPEERYKMVTAQVKDLCYGLYGKTSVPIDPEVQKKALKGYERGEKPITCRPAQVLEPELEKAKQEIGDLAVDDEDLILYALFPVTGKKFLMQKYGKEQVPESLKPITLEDVAKQDALIEKAKKGELVEKTRLEDIPEKSEYARTFNVFVEGDYFEVGVDEVGGAPVITYAAPAAAPAPVAAPAAPVVQAAPAQPAAPAPKPAPAAKETPAPAESAGTPVKAPMPGMVIKYEKNEGDAVNEGETVVVIEAMKMENALPAPTSGVIKSINYKSGDSVAKGEVLAVIE